MRNCYRITFALTCRTTTADETSLEFPALLPRSRPWRTASSVPARYSCGGARVYFSNASADRNQITKQGRNT